jgi:hypothetical protein
MSCFIGFLLSGACLYLGAIGIGYCSKKNPKGEKSKAYR